MEENILHEDDCNEEWWQPELHCENCGCTFMWSSYPNFPEYPTFCPNCGKKFTGLRNGKLLIFNLKEGVVEKVNN